MRKFIKALLIGYAVLWGVEELKSHRECGPAKRLRPRRLKDR